MIVIAINIIANYYGGATFHNITLKKEDYNGKVVEIYTDLKNHSIDYAILKNGEKIYLGHVYNRIQEGDSIAKNRNSTKIQVFRKDSIFYIDFKE
ncbi:hypothetical protein SAMN05421847_2871 [Halpernia humi]|uniref:Uncharacterized protein n=2 Tax=Halpernia humi TaxID=493375 RepID=A0A1H6BHJ5_9FLAO|nr:hypothetical protein SAMN05421847_2871 [Halpernia humi]